MSCWCAGRSWNGSPGRSAMPFCSEPGLRPCWRSWPGRTCSSRRWTLQWYRCHRLFRDVLRRELADSAPDSTSVLLGRAADWFLAQGQVEEAVEHRVAAGDARRSTGSAAQPHPMVPGPRRHGHDAAAERRPPGAELDPHLCLDLALAAGLSGQPGRSEEWLAAAEPHIEADLDPVPGWRTLRAYADFIWAVYGTTGDVEAALFHARRAVALETDPTLWGHSVALTCLGGELLGAGRIAESAEVLQQAWDVPARRLVPPFFLLQAAGLLALALVQLGETDRAHAVLADVRETASTGRAGLG